MPLYLRPVEMGRWLSPLTGGPASTSQTLVVGRVLLAQIVVPYACVIDGVIYCVGAASAGNVIGGLVGPIARTADAPDGAPVVAQSASTAQAAANTLQLLTWTAVSVQPGIYYAALEGDNATGTVNRHGSALQATGLYAQYDRSGGYGALTSPTPTTATGSSPAGLRLRIA
jgi:hypothetical protein